MASHPFAPKACFGNHEADVGLPALKKRLERWHERPLEAGALNVCVYLGGGLKHLQYYFYPYLGKWSNLTNIFQVGWNHQLDNLFVFDSCRNLKGLGTTVKMKS